jgi:hypothetical protein
MSDNPQIMLAVLWNGEVLLDVGSMNDNLLLMHQANFVVIDRDGALVVWKERNPKFNHLIGHDVDHRQMFQHAWRHVSAVKEAGCFGRSRQPGDLTVSVLLQKIRVTFKDLPVDAQERCLAQLTGEHAYAKEAQGKQ